MEEKKGGGKIMVSSSNQGKRLKNHSYTKIEKENGGTIGSE